MNRVLLDIDSQDYKVFELPVNKDTIPEYYNVIKNPMCLRKVKEKVESEKYKNSKQFLDDLLLIVKNA